MSAERLRVILDIDPTIEPIAGLMSVDGLPGRSFSGWMGLTRALERALTIANEAEANRNTSADTPSAASSGTDPMTGGLR